jgi:hypothetical protein
MTFKVYTNDVGSDGYSCFRHIRASSSAAALVKAAELVQGFRSVKVLAIPETESENAFEAASGTAPTGLRPKPGIFAKYGMLISAEGDLL